MAKLVIQNQGMTGRVCELHTDRTTVGRVEDNTFQITDPSVSSHHCEVLLRGNEIFIRDLNSTNGTFINDARITESVLKPGQTLKLGQIELKLEAEGAAAATAAASPGASSPAKKTMDSTLVIPRGVSLGDLESGGRPPGFESSTVFSKKKNKANTYFLIGAIVLVLVIVVVLIYAFSQVNTHK
ncbi:MAG TPA: FHA domain-containing protein [Verrucomicrobiae bacterium]|jgi:pSer/pThr/pTyr-binding forkhead associated (FHA) protein